MKLKFRKLRIKSRNKCIVFNEKNGQRVRSNRKIFTIRAAHNMHSISISMTLLNVNCIVFEMMSHCL
jgi:hypothetical protein